MINPVNNKRYKTIQNYSTLNKKTPISILTAENTIFIKTNQNKLTSNYLKNGYQIRHNKNYLSTTINQSQKINNSLKNTISLEKSILTKNFEKKIVKDINNKLNELLKYNKLRKNHYKGANSFIKIEKKSKHNLSSINNINGFSNNNHIFNFYNITSKLNNTSVKGKQKIKKEIKNFSESENINIRENGKNNINSIYTLGNEAQTLKHKNKEIRKSKSKIADSNLDKAKFYKKLNLWNNLSILINNSNNDNVYFKNINSYTNKERENSRISKQSYYSRRINNKYIYSIEKKKEKSLIKKRQNAKKPISYLAKNNFLNQVNNKKNLFKITLNLNGPKFEEKKNTIDKSSKRKNIGHKMINYKKNIYNIDNYNYNISVENGENKNNKKISELKIIEFDNDNINKTSPDNGNNSIKNNIENFKKNILNENNNVVNNNYYNINNTFIFDNFGNKLNQYDLTKLITKGNNSPHLNYVDMNNYNSNIFKTIDNDIERSKTNIIKNITRKIKKDSNTYINDKIKSKKSDYIINKLNLNKLSNIELTKLIKEKTGKNYLQFLTVNNKFSNSNVNRKDIIQKSNNISINHNKPSKNIHANKIKIRLKPKIEENTNREERNPNKKKLNNPNSLYANIIKKKKLNISKNKKLNNNDNIITSISNLTGNSMKNRKIISNKEKNDKKESKGNNNNQQQNKIIPNKLLKNQIKNKILNNDGSNIQENELFKQQIYNNYVSNIIEPKPKIEKVIENINNISFTEYENNDNNENYYKEIYSLEADRGQKERIQNSSFELVSLSENNLNDNELSKNEDNFDDINSIIKKINFNFEEDNDNDIFSQNNKKYKEFNKVFDIRFKKWIKNNNNLDFY